MGNAIKFTRRGKVLVLLEAKAELEDTVLLQFQVADSGIGIPSEKRESIFEAFSQADTSSTRKYGGTGLGLAISSRLVSMMQGRIWVESEVGRGSTFHFTVQFGRSQVVATRTARPKPDDELRGREAQDEPVSICCSVSDNESPALRILLVEDNAVNAALAARLLTKRGHTVLRACNGREAVDAFDKQRQGFDLVLMDIQMPEMNGYEATKAIRKKENGTRTRLPIIALTAHAMKGDREQCLLAGMDEYLSKPFQPKELFAALERLGSRSTREVPEPRLVAP